MSKKFLMILAALLLATSAVYAADEGKDDGFRQQMKAKVEAHRKEQESANKAFRETLKNMDEKQKADAMIAHRKEQQQKNLAFAEQLHQEQMAHLKERLAASKMTDAQKQEIISRREAEFKERTEHRKQQQSENIDFMEELKNSDLTPEQKREKMKAHREEQKTENKSFQEENKQERQEYRKKMRDDFKANRDKK